MAWTLKYLTWVRSGEAGIAELGRDDAYEEQLHRPSKSHLVLCHLATNDGAPGMSAETSHTAYSP